MRIIELFEGAKNRLSMSRLLMFLSFWPASYVLIVEPTEGMLAIFVGAFVLGYIGGKGADIFMVNRKQTSSELRSGHDYSELDAMESEPVARESKPIRRGKSRSF